MKSTALQQRPPSPRTRQQQQSRIWSMVVLLLFLGPIAVISGAILCELARAAKRPRAFAWLALAGVIGMALLAWRWRSLYDELLGLRDAAQPLVVLLRPKSNQALNLRQIGHALARVWPLLWRFWREALLLAPRGGAIAAWSSTGMTLPTDQLHAVQVVVKLLFGDPGMTLGEAMIRAKRAIGDVDVRRTWILHGDPTTRLAPRPALPR